MRYWRIVVCLAMVGLGAVIAAMRAQEAWSSRPVVLELVVPPAFVVPRDFVFGRYRLRWLGQGFFIQAQRSSGGPLWEVRGGFVGSGVGRTSEREGYWQTRLAEQRDLSCFEQSLESFERQGDRLILRGHLRCGNDQLSSYSVTFSDDHERGVRLAVELADTRFNRLYLGWRRGGGERLSGPSGATLPDRRIAFAGPGASRGNVNCLVSALRSFCTESGALQWVDLRGREEVQLEVHARHLVAYLSGGDSSAAMPIRQAPK